MSEPVSVPPDVNRRKFLAASAGAMALSLVETCGAPDSKKLGTHHIPEDKKLSKAWVDSLFARGETKVYRGEELTCIGMPIGGICAGQLYLRGDGTLADWGIFNHDHFTGYGETCYRTYTPKSPVKQGFGISVKPEGGEALHRTLDRTGFPGVEFIGEYPIGKVRYRPAAGDPFPVEVSLEAFSPFIPLNTRDSAIPGTVLRFRIRNPGTKPVAAVLSGWLQNVICERHAGKGGIGSNRILSFDGQPALVLTARDQPLPSPDKVGKPEVFADFESGTYDGWKKTGTAFGEKPAAGTLPNQQKVSGYGGKYLVNSFVGGDDSTGTLTSREFIIRRPYINFKIGGGNHPGKICINLRIDGKIVRTATGRNNERLEWDYWLVSDFQGKQAVLEIVDQQKGGWGHVNIDDIEFADAPPPEAKARRLSEQPDFGTMVLFVMPAQALTVRGVPVDDGTYLRTGEMVFGRDVDNFPLGQNKVGALAAKFTLAPGASQEVTYLLTWYFPGGEQGRQYSRWFSSPGDVVVYLRDNLDRLSGETHLFHDTYYDSTLPHWLLDRLLMPMSTLATDTVQWWRNSRFWAWEGVGCCHGTCTHVWNYAQGVAHLFPELERSARTMQDLGAAMDPKTGRVGFRGEDPNQPYAADGQCGTVLKCYREHLMSKDGSFLKENWPRIKKVMEYEIGRDGNADGVLEDKQWNTFDLDFVGPNTFVGALYLAALKAAAAMADLQGDKEFADRCRAIADKGGKWTAANLWNGEYFVQRIPQGQPTKFQYGDGCLADQLFGQNWASLTGLGYVYPAEQVLQSLKAIYRYNWAPDIGAQNKAYPPQRWFARPGEAGLFICTWPKGGRMQEPVLYRDEVWTGTEYQVASHLIHEGMLREGLSIIRGIHDRYDGRRHNPWNEVECGDHYARAMASWGCLLALCGYSYDGPAGRLGFAPRLSQPPLPRLGSFSPHQDRQQSPLQEFKAFFSAAEGWGSLREQRHTDSLETVIAVKYGLLSLKELVLELPEKVKGNIQAKVVGGGRAFGAKHTQEGRRIHISFEHPVTVRTGEILTVTLAW
jgi:uncharacterized protein (DUF608 family)